MDETKEINETEGVVDSGDILMVSADDNMNLPQGFNIEIVSVDEE